MEGAKAKEGNDGSQLSESEAFCRKLEPSVMRKELVSCERS
jgi:hypothetical protein